MNQTMFPRLIDKWSRVALTRGWATSWVEGAIFPREMVFFLARCEQLRIDTVIESGRQDGFSTKILSEFGTETDNLIYSIDYELEPQRAVECRQRLAHFSRLRLLKGDANILVGKIVARHPDRRIAILCDGPKGFLAAALLGAAAHWTSTHLVALHNLEGAIRDYFENVATDPCFYEGFNLQEIDAWNNLESAERARVEAVGTARCLDRSSLGVLRITDNARSLFRTTKHSSFGLLTPRFVRWCWRLQLHSAVAWINQAQGRWQRLKDRARAQTRRKSA